MNNPEVYQQSNDIHKRDVPEYLERYSSIIKSKKGHNRILDIGCGDGSVTNILKKFLPSNFKLLGCDISEKMVKFATKHHSNDQTSFTVMDITDELPKDMKGNFDLVFSFYTLNWVIDQKRAFENIFNLLNEGGECFMILVAYNPVFDVYRALSRSSKWNTWVNNVEKYISPYHDSEEPDKEIYKLMENIGFVNINVESKDRVFSFNDEDTKRKLITAINPFEIPKNKYEDFMNDYVKLLNEIERSHNVEANSSSNDVTVHYKSVVMYGQKPYASKILPS